MSKQFHRIAQWSALGAIALLFCYFRIKPIALQSVGYTFDQGRDFLKAAEIVLDHNITFIGPTTGIGGVFHGAWWYYVLSAAFILTSGSPIGFYICIFLIQSFAAILFVRFIFPRFGITLSLLLFLILATSGHFIFTTIFIANNVLAVPAVLVMATATLLLLEGRTHVRIPYVNFQLPVGLIAGLGLGFVAEFEFAFGLLLIPCYMILAIVGLWLKPSLRKKEIVLPFVCGFVFPFIPRILFEIKNGFPQTKVLWNFILYPAYHTPKPLAEVYRDRLQTFSGYYKSLFMTDLQRLLISFYVSLCTGWLLYKKKLYSHPVFFLCVLIFLLFSATLFYRDTFWSYYFDGIQFLFLLLGGYIISQAEHVSPRLFIYLSRGVLFCTALFALYSFGMDYRSVYIYDGIRVQKDIVQYIQALEGVQNDYCAIVYTPPVIPYTYDYLFRYYNYSKGYHIPSHEWHSKSCWFIIEHDDNKERKAEWISEHIPLHAMKLSKKQIKDVSIELWKKTP